MKEIHKIVAIVVQDNAFLMVRKVGKDIWTSLGGKPEVGESEREALVREIKEEVGCEAEIVQKLGDFTDKAIFDDAIVKISAYHVNLIGEIKLDDPELEEYKFLPSNYKELGIHVSPITENKLIPFCIKNNLLNW